MTRTVLVVDDDLAMCGMLRAHLERRGYAVHAHASPLQAFDDLRARDFDVVITDLNMRELDGAALCERIVADRPDVPVIVITAFGSMTTAIATIRAGAYDFIPKPFEIDALVVALERAIQHRRLRDEVRRLRAAVGADARFGELIGDSAEMRALFGLLDRIKDSEAPVLITGERGTGKDRVARALHAHTRSGGPFVTIDCAATPEAVLERELFGHAPGAVADSRTGRDGGFVAAANGTVFLDEVGELPLGLQAKLVRALEHRTVRPLGASADVRFDARIISATSRDLESRVADAGFRDDLYYRLQVLHVPLPPLRARGNDVLLLAQRLIARCAVIAGKRIEGVSPAAAERLLGYAWPGNVRELERCIERAVALAQYTELAVEDLPENIRDYRESQLVFATDDPAALAPMDEVERRYILRVLEAVGGNKTQAARILGFDRTTLYRKLERYGVSEPDPAT